jgi:hypothetical protein
LSNVPALRLEDLFDARPDFGRLDEITTARGILAVFHSRKEVGLCRQTTTENFMSKFIVSVRATAFFHRGGNAVEV